VGVRFSVGKLVEQIYLDASLSNPNNQEEGWNGSDTSKFTLDKHGMDVLRASLGHPLNYYSYSTRCVVSGVHGLDAGSTAERFLVASRLWAEGISAEYLTQSGVMLSLLSQQREESRESGTSVSSGLFLFQDL
jgi:hypothetical protein